MRSRPSWLVLSICAAGLWMILGLRYLVRTRDFVRTHDFRDQLTYTLTLAKLHRLPTVEESWEWSSPPLYFLLASCLAPDKPIHPALVRMVSLLMGALGVVLMLHLLRRLQMPALAALAVTLFVTTTPQYVFVFSTYNNDSLSTLLALSVIMISVEWVHKRNRHLWIALLVASMAGVYTKATVVNLLLIQCVIVSVAWVGGRLRRGQALRLLGAYAAAVGSFLPWLFRDLRLSSGRLFGFIERAQGKLIAGLELPHTAWRTLMTPPGITPGEWTTPFAGIWGMAATKKGSLAAYLFTTSLYGEFHFSRPPVFFIWLIVGLHATLSLAAFSLWRTNSWTKISAAAILLSFASYAIFLLHAPLGVCMDFRFITWSWMAWAVLYAAFWKWLRPPAFSSSAQLFPPVLFGAGILLHALFLMTAEGP